MDENNNVQQANGDTFEKPDGQQSHLQFSPEGWKDTLVKYARNIKYWGIFRDMSVPMKFVGDGSKIVRHIMWQFGLEGILYLGILKFNRTTLPYKYETWYNSEINFSKIRDIERGIYAEALEGGPVKYLKANENTGYPIPIDEDAGHINVLMDGMEFDFSRNYGLSTEQEVYGTANFYMGMVEVSREGNATEHVFKDLIFKTSSAYPNDDWIHSYDAPATRPNVSVIITGTIKIYHNKSVTPIIRAEVNDGVISGSTQTDLYNAASTAGTTVDAIINSTITVPAGSRVHIKLLGGAPADSTTQYTIKEGELKLDYVYRYPSTYIKAIYPYRLFEKLVDKMTTGKYTVTSAWLSAMKDYCITSGDAFRKIDNSVIKTSFSDFFKSLFARFSIGLSIDESGGFGNKKLSIEPLINYFGTGILMDLGQVSGAELIVAEDLIYNLIKAGYAKQEYTDANGKSEFNQGQQYSTPITRIIKELDLTSPYRADPFGIELLRINYEKKKTTDTNSDNDTFFLNIVPAASTISTLVSFISSGNYLVFQDNPKMVAGQKFTITGSLSNDGTYTVTDVDDLGATQTVYTDITITVPEVAVTVTLNWITGQVFILNRPAFTAVTGIPHPSTAFNLLLSPKYGLLNNGAYLHSIFDLMDTEKIKFQTADKNKDLSTTLAGVTVTENADIEIGGLPAQLFRPYYFNFKTQVPVDLLALINNSPYGKIQFTWNERTWYGGMVDGGIKPGTKDVQSWKLLCSPENDLSKFNA